MRSSAISLPEVLEWLRETRSIAVSAGPSEAWFPVCIGWLTVQLIHAEVMFQLSPYQTSENERKTLGKSMLWENAQVKFVLCETPESLNRGESLTYKDLYKECYLFWNLLPQEIRTRSLEQLLRHAPSVGSLMSFFQGGQHSRVATVQGTVSELHREKVKEKEKNLITRKGQGLGRCNSDFKSFKL